MTKATQFLSTDLSRSGRDYIQRRSDKATGKTPLGHCDKHGYYYAKYMDIADGCPVRARLEDHQSHTRGRYRYYGCSARCGVPSLTEKDLSARFLEHIQALRIDDKIAESMLTAIRESDGMRATESRERMQRLEEKRRSVQATIDPIGEAAPTFG